MTEGDGKWPIFWTEAIFAFGLFVGSGSLNSENFNKLVILIGQYILYLLLIKASHEAFTVAYNVISNKHAVDYQKSIENSKKYATIFIVVIGVLVYFKAKLLEQDFILIFIAYLITKYHEMEGKQPFITYGVGMACSFFEGYLTHIIPNDGAKFVGFEENITIYEANQNVVFPVKKMFIIITKSLYCPPDLKHFNKKDKNLPYLEACLSLEDVQKDVAGVKNRIYRNSAYKIHRPDGPPVYLAAECASPLHTLHRVLEKRALYEGTIDVHQVVEDFCNTLRTIIARSPDCRDKCELVYFDDEDPNRNLSEVLLEKIRELEPKFENIIRR